MRARRAALAALLALPACQGPGVPAAELPAGPIAIAWRDPELARRRAEYLASLDPEKRGAEREERWGQVGVVPVDEVQSLLEGVTGTRSEPARLEYAPRLALLDPLEGRVTPVAAARPGALPLDWSPDRQRLLFTQLEGPYLQLYEYDVARQEVRPLTRGPGVHPRGCYGADGQLVVMRVTLEGQRPVRRIALAAPGGLEPEILSQGPDDRGPTCAPDGRSVVWVTRLPDGRDHLVALSLVGERSPRRLGPGRDPAFGPDGHWVVFSAWIGDRWQLWRIRPDGTGRARVGTGALDEVQPAVSPDGRHVAYVVEEDHRSSLYLRRLDGSGDRILFRDGDAESPVW